MHQVVYIRYKINLIYVNHASALEMLTEGAYLIL
jgi:hypothetical protein